MAGTENGTEPGVKTVPSISELVPMIQSDLIAKRPKTSGPNPMEELLRARISELASVIRKKAETRKIPLMLIPRRAPLSVSEKVSCSRNYPSSLTIAPQTTICQRSLILRFFSRITPNVPETRSMLSKVCFYR